LGIATPAQPEKNQPGIFFRNISFIRAGFTLALIAIPTKKPNSLAWQLRYSVLLSAFVKMTSPKL
jgi:hypothetical protein